MSVKPYFQPKDNYDIKLDELEAPIELDKLEAPVKLDKLEVPVKLDELKVPAKLDKLEVLLFTVEVPQEFTKPVKPIKCG